jgi:hypothetical protein
MSVLPLFSKGTFSELAKPELNTDFIEFPSNGMSDGNVIFSLQPASIGRPTVTIKSSIDFAPTI